MVRVADIDTCIKGKHDLTTLTLASSKLIKPYPLFPKAYCFKCT